jgi:error-prone DNA polymerase
VTHRQRPSTARGVTFISLEDETGLINVIVSQGCWKRFRNIAINASALVVRGRIESVQGVVNIIAEHLSELKINVHGVRSRDFR